MDSNLRKDQHVNSLNFSEKQQYLPRSSVSDMYMQNQQALLPAQNTSNYPSRIQEDCLYPKLSAVTPLMPNTSYGALNELPSLTRSSDVHINKTINTLCSENTNPRNNGLVGIMKEPIIYQPVTTVTHLSAFNSSPKALQSQANSGNLQMLRVPSHQFRVQTSTDNWQQTTLPGVVSSTSLPNGQSSASSNKLCLVWVPHQNSNQPVAQQMPMESTPFRAVNTNLESKQRAGIPNSPSQNKSVPLQPKPPYLSTLTTHMQRNKPVSQQRAAIVLPQPLNMQMLSHQTTKPIVTISQGQSQKYIIHAPVQQPYISTEKNLNQPSLDPQDFLSNSSLQPIHCQPPPGTQPPNVQNQPKILEIVSPNLNALQVVNDSNGAQMSSRDSSKPAETVSFNRCFVSENSTSTDVGILQNVCKNGKETQTNCLAPSEKFPGTLNTLLPNGGKPVWNVELSSPGSRSDPPVNFGANNKEAQILTEDDMFREVQVLLQAKQDFINLVKDFKEKRRLYKSLKYNDDFPANVNCSTAANELTGTQEQQIIAIVPDSVTNIPSLPLKPFKVITEQQNTGQHKLVQEKKSICTYSIGSSQSNSQYKLPSQKVPKDSELLIYVPDEKHNYVHNKASSELEEINFGNQNYSKLLETNETMTLPQDQVLVTPSSKEDRSPMLDELITEAINSYSILNEAQSCFPNTVENPNDAVHPNENLLFSESNMPHNSYASPDISSTVTDECLKEGTATNFLTEDESCQLNNLTEVLKSCIGMWKVPNSVRKMESNLLPNTNTSLKQALSASGHQKNVQQTLSKTESSRNTNDTSHYTVAVSSSTIMKASEPQVAIVNPLVPFNPNNAIVDQENESVNIGSDPVSQEGSVSMVNADLFTKGVFSGDSNLLLSNLHPKFDETVLDAPLSVVDQGEMVTISASSCSGNTIKTESIPSLQSEKIIKCLDVPDHPKSPHVPCYAHEKHEPFKSQTHHACEDHSLLGGELNVNGLPFVCVEDAVDEQLRIASICTLVEGSTLYDSQIAQMFDRISTYCKTSQEESVDLIIPSMLEASVPSTTQALDIVPQRLTNRPLLNQFADGNDEHHSIGTSKVLVKFSENNPDLAQTSPESCTKEGKPVAKNKLVKHPCLTSEMEDINFRKSNSQDCIPLTPIEICTLNSEKHPFNDQDTTVQKDCVVPGYSVEDDDMNILSAQCLNDQFSAVQFKPLLTCTANVEMHTPSVQDRRSEKENSVISVDPIEDDNLYMLSSQCLSDQLSELQKEFPYGFEQLECIHSSKNSLLVNQKTFVARDSVAEEECLHSSEYDVFSDIYGQMKDCYTNYETEHYVAKSKLTMGKLSNEHSDSELSNLYDGCESSQPEHLQLDDCDISLTDICDSDKDDSVKQIKITVLDSEQMFTVFPENTMPSVNNCSTESSQQNVQSEENSLTQFYSGNDNEILQTESDENCSASNEKIFCCLYSWLSSYYGLAPKCSCVPGSKTDYATNVFGWKASDAIVVDNTADGNGEIIDLLTESSDEEDSLPMEDDNQKRQISFVTITDVKQVKDDSKTSPIKSKNRPTNGKNVSAEQNMDQPLHVAQSEIEPLCVQEKGHLAQPACANISGKGYIDLKNATDFQPEEGSGKSDNISVSCKSKNERLIVKTDFLKSKNCAAFKQDQINGKACNTSETSDFVKRKRKLNGEQSQNLVSESTKPSKTIVSRKELNLGFSSNGDQYNKNAKTRRNTFLPQTPLHITTAKKTEQDCVKQFNLSDTSDEEIESVEPACSQEPCEEQYGLDAEAAVQPQPKLTNVKVPSKKDLPGNGLCCETIVPQCSTNNNSDVKYSSKCHTENVLLKNTLTIQERSKLVSAGRKTVTGKQTNKNIPISAVQNVSIPNLDKSKKSDMSLGENPSSDCMKKVLPENRGRPSNSMTSKSCPLAHKMQKVDSFSGVELLGGIVRLDSNPSISKEKPNAHEQGTKESKVHYLNRVGFTNSSSERIHLRKLSFGISPIKLGGGRPTFKPCEATAVKKTFGVAVSQNVVEKAQMLEFKLCPEVLLTCSSVDEKSTNDMLIDTEKSSTEGIRSRKEDWLKNIPLKKRKVDMTKFQAESPLLDKPICVPNASPTEAAKSLASGSKATFHAYKQLYLEKRSKSLNITSGK